MSSGIYRNPKLLALAKGMACIECGIEDDTIISAHSNQGKGMGIKASDSTIMFLCYRCHTELDCGIKMTREEKREFTYRNNAKTLRLLLEEGYLNVTGKRR